MDSHNIEDQRPKRRGDGGIYLVVADESEEFAMTLRYAARRAEANRAHVGIIYIITQDDFQTWGKVEAIMRKEQREAAEKFLWNIAKGINELNGLSPALYIAEGNKADAIINTINEDKTIRLLMLGGRGGNGSDHGPLVSYFTGKGLHKLRVPVVLVPGDLNAQMVDDIAL